MAFETTLNRIRDCHPCKKGWEKLLSHIGKTKADDEPLSLLTILDGNGIDYAPWCCQAISGHDRDFRLFCFWRARQAQHLMDDPRIIDAIDVAVRFANGTASREELDMAKAAARDAARDAAWDAAMDAQEARFHQMLLDGVFVGSTK